MSLRQHRHQVRARRLAHAEQADAAARLLEPEVPGRSGLQSGRRRQSRHHVPSSGHGFQARASDDRALQRDRRRQLHRPAQHRLGGTAPDSLAVNSRASPTSRPSSTRVAESSPSQGTPIQTAIPPSRTSITRSCRSGSAPETSTRPSCLRPSASLSVFRTTATASAPATTSTAVPRTTPSWSRPPAAPFRSPSAIRSARRRP